MAPADRALIMEVNRSLRSIKNELETLLEKGVIDESVYDQIHSSLPEESPLSGPLRTSTSANQNASQSQTQERMQSPPVRALNNLSISNNSTPQPSGGLPSYEDTPPPNLPNRNNSSAPPAKPIVARARALYRYNASDARDVTFEKDDQIEVLEYMNADWWMGRNTRTGLEGIFPRNYVLVESETKSPTPQVQQQQYSQQQQQQYNQQPQYGYPPQSQGPPGQQSPYNANVPPMAVAEGQQGSGKKAEYGKKFGKKMGNAAIFGAGATIGSNIVNSIF